MDCPRAGVTVYYCLDCNKSEAIDGFASQDLASRKSTKANAKAQDIAKIIESYHDEIKFDILVWGPSLASNDPVKMKRNELLQSLKSLNHRASMSEDNCTGKATPTNLQEMIDSNNSDLVICLATSFGSIGEAHEVILGLKQKALVWFKEKAKDAYAGQGLAKTLRDTGTYVEFFSDEQIACCAVKTASELWVRNRVNLCAQIDESKRRLENIDPRRPKLGTPK